MLKPQPPLPLKVLDIKPHPEADRLEILTIAGFQTIVATGFYSVGDHVLFYEPGTCFTPETIGTLGIGSYLRTKTDRFGNSVGVVREVKLRGRMSEGLLLKDVVPSYKFEPPAPRCDDATSEHEKFPAFGSITNLRHDPGAPQGPVVVTEKIHGTNSRVGYTIQEDGSMLVMAGSRTLQRRKPEAPGQSLYWLPLELYPQILDLFQDLWLQGNKSATLYGEIYGPGVQSYTYGLKAPDYRAFELRVEGQKTSHQELEALAFRFEVPMAPVLYRGPYQYAFIQHISEGPSMVAPDRFSDHGREGVVVRNDSKTYKYVAQSYLLGKKGQALETTDL
jgi:hypothetical protein